MHRLHADLHKSGRHVSIALHSAFSEDVYGHKTRRPRNPPSPIEDRGREEVGRPQGRTAQGRKEAGGAQGGEEGRPEEGRAEEGEACVAARRPSELFAPVKGAERREIGHVLLEVGKAGNARVKRMVYPAGFRWSKDMKPVVGTELCMHAHVGFLVHGEIHIEYPDGCVIEHKAPQIFAIEPGHDGWVVGKEPVVMIEFDFEGDTIAKLGHAVVAHTHAGTRSRERAVVGRVGRAGGAGSAAALFLFAFVIRVRGLESHFWLLGDQIRDWGIALRPFHELPLVGPATHVGGYTIGPAYYWIMWAVRVLVGPWFDNLPHAGGYGQAAIESAADALLFVALWRRVQSPWVALAAAIVIVTSGFDVALSAIDWTPPIASALGKAAIALILLDWHRGGGAARGRGCRAGVERPAGLHRRRLRHRRRRTGAGRGIRWPGATGRPCDASRCQWRWWCWRCSSRISPIACCTPPAVRRWAR